MSAKETEAKAAAAATATNSAKNWKERLMGELRWNKKLIVLKLVLFFFQGGTMGFLPFLTLHMQQLGITVKEIAIVYAFLPIASLLGPPTSGIIADKFGRYKIVVIINIIITTILHCCLLYVPPRDKNSLTFTCGSQEPRLTWDTCDYCHDDRNGSSLDLVLQNCKFLCDTPPEEPKLCYYTGHNTSTCHTFDMNTQLHINGTISSLRANDTCSHRWLDLTHDERSYQGLRCFHNCPIRCQVKGMPHCEHPDDPSNKPDTFWIYFAIRITATFFLASAFTMLDATTLAVIRDHDGDFGKQRVLNMIGQAVVPLIAGILVDFHSSSIGYSDYMPALYLGASFNVIAVILVGKLHCNADKAGDNILSDLKKLITKPEIDLFLVMIWVLGCNWGFIESYLFVYLIELNAPNYMLGLTLTVGCIVGVPVMYVTDKIVNKLGRHMVFIISFATYAIRQFGYANITDPWLVFPFEMLEVFTYQIMWVAAVTFCPILAPKGLLATMTGLAGAIHYSVGRGVGALLGGYLIAQYGLSFAFSFFGYVCVIGGGLYTLVYIVYIKRRTQPREKELNIQNIPENADEGKPMIKKASLTGVIITSKTETNADV
ncbi:major facilitator superfamily domain-containing protein 6-like [Macrobrachium nipponense]|uniref:major facilitator superfamily domain-containing protein 6-like n=1 Tax=Macrobrachium nipponense TaxID=159736 RepID=UPI0030C7CA8B